MTWFDDKIKQFEGDPEFEFEKALLEFEETLVRNIKPMPPEFIETVDKLFRELLKSYGLME